MTTVNSYDKNQEVRLQGSFKILGTLTDPTAVTLKVRDPQGNITVWTYPMAPNPETITKDSTGVYFRDIILYSDGDWYYRWEGVGVCDAAAEKRMVVTRTKF